MIPGIDPGRMGSEEATDLHREQDQRVEDERRQETPTQIFGLADGAREEGMIPSWTSRAAASPATAGSDQQPDLDS